MKRTAITLTLAAAIAAAGCLEKDTTSTIYLRQDGSFDWVILEQNVRSDAEDAQARTGEEAEYVNAVANGKLDAVEGLLALGARDVHVRWLRSRRPFAVVVDARFDALAGVFDRVLAPCGIPYDSTVTDVGGIRTWTLRADVGIDGERFEAAGSEACGNGLENLDDAFEHLRIMLESGEFTAAKGFTLQGSIAAAIDEAGIEESAKTTGLIELSLSWR